MQFFLRSLATILVVAASLLVTSHSELAAQSYLEAGPNVGFAFDVRAHGASVGFTGAVLRPLLQSGQIGASIAYNSYGDVSLGSMRLILRGPILSSGRFAWLGHFSPGLYSRSEQFGGTRRYDDVPLAMHVKQVGGQVVTLSPPPDRRIRGSDVALGFGFGLGTRIQHEPTGGVRLFCELEYQDVSMGLIESQFAVAAIGISLKLSN